MRARAVATAAALAASLAVTVVPAAQGVPAAPSSDAEVVRGRYLVLTSVFPGAPHLLAPGDHTDWVVGVAAPGAGEGTVQRSLTVVGPLAQHVQVTVESCGVRWTTDGCPAGGARTLRARASVDAGGAVDLGTQDAREPQWLRMRVVLPEGSASVAQARSGSLRLEARGFGESAVVAAGGTAGAGDDHREGAGDASGSDGAPMSAVVPGVATLPRTGAALAPWAVVAALAVVVGAMLRRVRDRHQERHQAGRRKTWDA